MEDRFDPKLLSRLDYQLILSYVTEKSKVLDLGCGDGKLLNYLEEEKGIIGRGIEISSEGVHRAMEKGLSVIQGNIDEGLSDYEDKSFDWVILSQTLQVIREPALVILEMLRVGKKVIVSFPNFGHIRVRFHLLFNGRMPKTRLLPQEWYNTPNIRMLTIKDFLDFIEKNNIRIVKKFYFTDYSTLSSGFKANLFSRMAMFILEDSSSLPI
jgi:methionine biosynthesis protein MetW